MKTIGIKLADGSFYPVLEEGTREEKQLDLTTAHNNQTRIMVDMYRSETCSIDDAEYVDTLQIDNLKAHPNGEPDISFTVSLDDDNNLFAKIVDSETGAQSKTTITLVSRTEEERITPDSYTIEEPTPNIATGAGLLAAAMSINGMQEQNEDKQPMDDEPLKTVDDNDILNTDIPDTTDDTITADSSDDIFGTNDLDTTTPDDNDIFATNDLDSTPTADDNNDIFATNDLDSTPTADDNNDIFGTDGLDSLDDMPATDETVTADNNDIFGTDDTASDTTGLDDIPDFPADDTITADSSDDIFGTNDLDTTTPDDNNVFATDNLDSTTIADDNDIFATNDLDSTPTADDNNDIFATNDLDSTPTADDNNDIFGTDGLDSLDDMPATDETVTADNNDIFGTDDTASDTTGLDDIPDFPADDSFGNEPETDLFSTNDLDNFGEDNSGIQDDSNDDIFGDSSDDDWNNIGTEKAQTGNQGISFTGLYDKETALGQSGDQTENQKNKTKIPVIICVVCAVICVIATLFILLVIPSKFNLLKKNSEETDNKTAIEITAENDKSEESNSIIQTEKSSAKTQEPIATPAEKEPEPIPVAVEDEIVVIEEAEKVIPELPPEPVPEKKPEPKITTYKIKWGDTLWDIANAYYKNPWKYKFIARYNGIKNPDQIISGTIIYLPEN